MLPIFLQELFTAFRLFNFSVQKWGKMLPIFWRELLQGFDFTIFL